MTIPDKISLTRIPLGGAVLLLALNHNWDWALAAFTLGTFTDALDGWVATTWQLGTIRGAELIDPVCDLALTLGALGGLLLTGNMSWWLVPPLLIAYGFLEFVNIFHQDTALFYRFVTWMLPMFYLVVLSLLILRYAHLTLTAAGFLVFLIAQLTICLTLMILKRQRLSMWLHPQVVEF